MILYLNCNTNKRDSWTKDVYLLRAAKRLGIKYVKKYEPQKEPVEPEYVLNIEPYSFKKGKKWTGIWEIDLLLQHQLNPEHYKQADVIFCAVNFIPKVIKPFKEKCVLLYQACDPKIHHPYKEIRKKYDIVFYGNDEFDIYSERRRIYKLLQEKYNVKMGGRHLSPPTYSKLLNEAKIQFIRSLGQTPEQGEIAQRFFECLAIGPVLTNWCEDLSYLGGEGIDFCSYRNDEEMFLKLDRLLKDENYREYVANNGRKKALAFHTYQHRLATILYYANRKRHYH